MTNKNSLLRELGLPTPEQLVQIMQEMRRLNGNMESIKGDIQTLARYAPSLTTLAQAMQGLRSDDIRNLATALTNAQLPRATSIMERGISVLEGLYNKLKM